MLPATAQDLARQQVDRLEELETLFRKNPPAFQAHLVALLEDVYAILESNLGGPRA